MVTLAGYARVEPKPVIQGGTIVDAATATTWRVLTAEETALVGGGDFTWGGFFGHVAGGALAGGLAGATVAGVGAGAGALAGGLLGGIEYSVASIIEDFF
jgi:hypothetical protein